MKHYIWWIIAILIILGAVITFSDNSSPAPTSNTSPIATTSPIQVENTFPMAISAMRAKSYPGSTLTIEQKLSDGSNYHRYVVYYLSDGLKIYGLLTIPVGNPPKSGWPVILVDHGYIPPAQYSTIDSYAIVVDPLASNGYVVFKPDYRGNGNSEGTPTQIYVSPDYVTDSMNALASVKRYPGVNPNKIGLWAHSMGGNIALHELVITNAFKAADIWSGVVGSYTDILNWWQERLANHSISGNDLETSRLVQQFEQQHGTPQTNPSFWNAIDPTKFISSINTPLLIQVGTADEEVPPSFSENLYKNLKNMKKSVQIETYPGADHNLSSDSTQAMQASIQFFDKYLK